MTSDQFDIIVQEYQDRVERYLTGILRDPALAQDCEIARNIGSDAILMELATWRR